MTLYYFLRWCCLILLGLLIYGQTFQFDFVFDDHFFILNNPYIRSFSHVHLMWHTFPLTRLTGIYSFAFNYFLNQLHPRGYHIFNFIVHLVSTGLVWALAGLLFKITKTLEGRITKELPFLIAVLFLVHPCQTQAVSYIAQRFESMATMFYLATMYCYLSARVSKDHVRHITLFGLSGLFTILGILTKEVVITVPAMLLASEWILFPKKNNTKLYIVLAVGSVLLYALFTKLVYADLSVFFQSIPSDSHSGDVLTPVRYFLTQMRVFLTFLRLLILPIHQNVDYDYPVSTDLLHPALTLAGLGTIIFITFLIFKLRRNSPLIAFGLSWILITFSINLAPRSNVIFEHKLYLISFGFFLTFVTTLSLLIPDRGTLTRILLCVITVLAIASFQRNKVWKEDFTLWNDAIQKSPHKERPYNNRGLAWAQQGNLIQAFADYNKAIQINPHYINTYINRGFLYNKEGNFSLALSDFNKAINLNPDLAGAYINRGNVYQKMGSFTLALADYNKAITFNQNTEEAYNDRGNIYFRQGHLIQALADYKKAIELNPDYADAYCNLAFIYYKQGNFTQAILNYGKTIEIEPDDTTSYYNRAVSYYRLKEYDQAWSDARRIEELGSVVDPQLINALKEATAKDQ